jgi:glutamate-1-semialdehyde 2,1-aminomutase
MTNVTFERETLEKRYQRQTPRSQEQFQAARAFLPGGVSRDTVGRSPHPIYMERADGKYLWDLDGNRYLDFCMNYGPNLLGHCPPAVVEGVRAQAEKGFGIGAPTQGELEAARRVSALYPGADMVRFTNSGTEAIMHMLRAARAFAARRRIVKFEGAYHGSADAVQTSIHPSAGTRDPGWRSIPESTGIPPSTSEDTLAVPYNDIDALAACFAAYPGEIAGVIVDPCMNACGLAQPDTGFLQNLAKLAHANGALLLFDEVVSGFRYGPGGAQELFGVRPDLVSFGKCLGGGMPLGALGGRADVMEVFVPDERGLSRVPHGGTLNANPLGLAATLAFLDYVEAHPNLYAQLNALGSLAREELGQLGERFGVPLIATGAQSMFQVHFGIDSLRNHDDFARRDERFRQHLFLYLATHGMYTPAAGAWFMAEPHTEADILAFVQGVAEFLEEHYIPLLAQEESARSRAH